MDGATVVAYAIFVAYFALIAGSFILVFISLGGGKPADDLVQGRPFVYLRIALGALICTWYFMFQFLKWSYLSYRENHAGSMVGEWLVNTSLFEQAWRAVCVGAANWWWSSWICTSAVFFTAGIYYASAQRGIRFPWAYMLLGQLVAISVAIALFLAAVYMHPARPIQPKAPMGLWLMLLTAMYAIYILPGYARTPTFMPVLGAIHGAVWVPLFFTPGAQAVGERRASIGSLRFRTVFALLIVAAVGIHYSTTQRLIDLLPPNLPKCEALWETLYHTVASHPAQGSVSLDVVWVGITTLFFLLLTGSTAQIVFKGLVLAAVIAVGAARYLGVNWLLIGSLFPIVGLLGVAGAAFAVSRLRSRNKERRAAFLDRLGIKESTLVAGTDKEAPYTARRRIIAGFWHPYCNAGGGGERVLWTAIAWLQREDPDVIVLVYSGDYPAASKDEILARVMDRFSIKLSPATLEFVPLPSRHLISDNYWRRFTLLGQSFGSVMLAWQGLCGKDGLWGDIFIDSMGYGFVLPAVRVMAGSDVAIGAYTHYPTVSADMVKRVRERSGTGVEDGGVSKSAAKTWAKLVYYNVFTALYATALLFSEHTMTNSSWTQAHLEALLGKGRRSALASLLLMDETSTLMREKRGEASSEDRAVCEVVYPPCDTTHLATLGNLEGRKRELVSLAQFRPEKDHAKQLHALKLLFDAHPECRSGKDRVQLTLIGGSRGDADEARLAALRAVAVELDISDSVEFVVNAPYPDVVARLGAASIGLNTMQDEHFGINVVEFMAAGLIPIVHASAGPLLDIVVPSNDGQRTGLHATDAASFAEAIWTVLGMPPGQQLKMRHAAREIAGEKFSEAAFEGGFERGWMRLVHRAEERLGASAGQEE